MLVLYANLLPRLFSQAEPGVFDGDEYSDYEEMPETAVPKKESPGSKAQAPAAQNKRKPGGGAGAKPARKAKR